MCFVRDVFRHWGPVVFLDKLSIDQENVEVMQAGIRKLGAFLAQSDRMVVAHTKLYFVKLWTVYEIACFLSLKDASHLKLVPVSQAMCYLVAVVMLWVWCLAGYIGESVLGSGLIAYLVALTAVIPYFIAQRRWARDKTALTLQLRCFEVRACLCAVESDRPKVYHNIGILMRRVLDLPVDADLDCTLNAFNELVRTELPDAVAVAFGRFAFDYKHYVMLGVAGSGTTLLDSFEGFSDGTPLRSLAACDLYLVLWIFVLWPTSAIALETLSELWLNLHGWREVVYNTLAVPAALVVPIGADLVFKKWRKSAESSDVALALLALASFAGVSAALAIGWCGVSRCIRASRALPVIGQSNAPRSFATDDAQATVTVAALEVAPAGVSAGVEGAWTGVFDDWNGAFTVSTHRMQL